MLGDIFEGILEVFREEFLDGTLENFIGIPPEMPDKITVEVPAAIPPGISLKTHKKTFWASFRNSYQDLSRSFCKEFPSIAR